MLQSMPLQRLLLNLVAVPTIVTPMSTITMISTATVILTTVAITPAAAQDAILQATDPQAQINLRAAPDPNARSLGYGLVGDRVEILEQVPGANDYTWYRVRFYVSGAVGWIRNDFIQVEGGGTGASDRPSAEARYQDGYSAGYPLGYRDGQNARRYSAGNHPDKFLQAGSGNPDANYDNGFRAGFLAGFAAGYQSNPTSAASQTILTFQTANNAVRIFNRSGQVRMNIFDKRNGTSWLNSVPVQVEQNQQGTYYRYQADETILVFQGRDGTHTLEIGGQVETGY
jgi:Bacterial SH3 domain